MLSIEIQTFPTPNTHRAHAPCNPEAHFYRVDERSDSLLKPILYCPACGWTYEEIIRDKAMCTYGDCEAKRVAGTARCENHQEG